MRVLRFIVNDQIIERDPDCDFSGLVPGTSGYLMAEFSFSPAWKNCVKIVEFSSWGANGTRGCPPQFLKDGKSCYIPAAALEGERVRLRVVGRRIPQEGSDKPDYRIITDSIEFSQSGGKR